MSAEQSYEAKWQVCPECGHRRPVTVLGADGKCTDGWHAVLMKGPASGTKEGA